MIETKATSLEEVENWLTSEKERECQYEHNNINETINKESITIFHDRVLYSNFWTRHSSRWGSFLLAHRFHEQLGKRIAFLETEFEYIGHRMKTRWYDKIEDQSSSTPYKEKTESQKILDWVKFNHKRWQAIFHSPWETYEEMLACVQSTFNAKEYSLVEKEKGSYIHPMLPPVLLEAINIMMGILQGIHQKDYSIKSRCMTPHCIRETIGDEFRRLENIGINLDIDRLNDVNKQIGSFILWSRIFNQLKPYKYKLKTKLPESRWIPYRDGSKRIMHSQYTTQKEQYSYYDIGKYVLMNIFGNEGLAASHLEMAKSLANKPDWRLQFFIKCSEHKELSIIDGVLTVPRHIALEVSGRMYWTEWGIGDSSYDKREKPIGLSF